MPVLTKTESGFAIAAGQYLLKLASCAIVDGTNYQTKEPEKQLKWAWEIERVMEVEPTDEQQEHVGAEFWEWTSVRCTPNSKACARAEALLGRPLATNEDLDTDLLLGRRVKATFIGYQRANGQPGTKIGPVVPYQQPAKVTGGSGQATAEPVTAAANPTFTPATATDPRPSGVLLGELKAAYEAVIAAKKLTPADVTAIMRDLWGKGSSGELTIEQAGILLAVLTDQREIHIDPEGKWTLGLPF